MKIICLVYMKKKLKILGPNLLHLLLHFVSSVMAGECIYKLWSIGLDERDCGKGVLSDILSNSLDNIYVV